MFDLKQMRVIALALAVIVGGTPVCAVASDPHIRQDASGRLTPVIGDIKASPEQEIQLGRKAQAEVVKQLPVLPDNNPVSQYVQQLGAKLASKAPGYKWPFNFHVVNQKEINAFALPGGPVYINLGTIQQADESELAGVMAHEISHVVMRHSMREASKSQWIQIGGALGSAVLGGLLGNSMAGQLAQLGIQLGAGSVIMKYSREAETEADLIGSQIMYDAGYNPYAMVEFFQVLAKQGGGSGVPQFLSDHPNPGNRAETVSEVIRKFPKKDFPRYDSQQFTAMKQIADGMKPMTAQEIAKQQKQRGGGTIGGGQGGPMPMNGGQIMPASSFKNLNQGSFQMSYPSNWEVFQDQNGSGLTIAPRAGVSDNAIAYGVVLNAARPQSRTSLDSATSQIIDAMQRQNPDLQVAGNPQQIRVNGVQGRSVDMMSTSPLQSQGGGAVRERDWLVTLPRQDGSVMFLVFIAPEQQFDQLRPAYEQMLRSLKVR